MLIIRVKALVKNAKGVKKKALVKGAKRCVKGISEGCLRIKSSGIWEECLGRIIDEVHRYTYKYLFISKDGDILDGVVTRSGSP